MADAILRLIDAYGSVTFAQVQAQIPAARGELVVINHRTQAVLWLGSDALVDAIDLLRPYAQAEVCSAELYEVHGSQMDAIPVADSSKAGDDTYAQPTWVPVLLRRRTQAELQDWERAKARAH